jgi:hypothetical protein
MRIIKPRGDENCALEHKSIAVIRDAESVEQTLKRIPREQQIEYLPALTREIQ